MNECTIQKILSVHPIENSDNIEQVKVLGWSVVVKKGEFKEGDLCVYVSLDTQLPEKPEFEFLRKDHFRIRTKKLRGCISQGLVLPLSILPDNHYPFKISDDVSVLLEATHYEKPIPVNLRGLVRGNFPSGVPKTDEIRCCDGDTLITTNKGDIKISDICNSINLTYKILTYDIENKKNEYISLTNTNISENNNDWYEIEIENNKKIILTGDHLVYLPEFRCYRCVKNLVIGDFIKNL